MTGVRRDMATLGPGWNQALEDYALAMEAMDALPASDRRSWKFLAAIHGFHKGRWVEEGAMAPATPVPPEYENQTYGKQCQHRNWYFLPWHRGYLASFESIVAAKVMELTGRQWALPYWNYLDSTNPNARMIPQPFRDATMPNGRPNPFVKYRVANNVAIPSGEPDFDLSAMRENDFLVDGSGGASPVGFGGTGTGAFSPPGMTGDLEANPHNSVHVILDGVMGDPRTAGLHPLFWLHHCNIDRLWEAWMRTPGKNIVRAMTWLDGPIDRKFIVPKPDGDGETYTARDGLRNGKFYPTYDNLTSGTGVTPVGGAVTKIGMGPPEQQKIELLGANGAAISVGAAGVVTNVAMDTSAAKGAVTAMGPMAAGKDVVRLYLQIVGIKGETPSAKLDVFLNLPEGADPGSREDLRVARLYLFGLEEASDPDSGHGGNGLGYNLEISELVQRLRDGDGFDADKVSVTLLPVDNITDDAKVTVQKVSVIRRTGRGTVINEQVQ